MDDHALNAGRKAAATIRGAVAGFLILCSSAGIGQAQGVPATPLPLCPVADGMAATYDIVRSGSVIGRHTLAFAQRGANLTVTITVEANLYALGIRVYHYEHRGREVWHDGRMLSMDTRTVDDGAVKQVSAVFDPARGVWGGTTGATPVAGPLMASSFWNSGTVRQSRFLDDETGAVNAVQVTPAGQETLTLNGRPVPASRFELAGNTSGSVWYDRQGCWVRALFKSPVDGSVIDVRSRG